MSDSEEYYSEEEHGFYRDITTMSEEDREDWRREDASGYEQNFARQLASESAANLSTEHPISPHADQRVLELEDDKSAHGGANAIIAARMKEREARDPDPQKAGDCLRTIREDIELQASRLRKKHNLT